jgi:hypothetical protein
MGFVSIYSLHPKISFVLNTTLSFGLPTDALTTDPTASADPIIDAHHVHIPNDWSVRYMHARHCDMLE